MADLHTCKAEIIVKVYLMPIGTDTLTLKKSDVRTPWEIIPSLDYCPIRMPNLKFYAVRFYDYTSYAQSKFGVVNSATGMPIVELISPLRI